MFDFLPDERGEQTVTAGARGLAYAAATDTYPYTWKTDKVWAGSCRQLIIRLSGRVTARQ